MLLVTPVHSRRVLVLGAAGLVPAALVTLLLVHQPSIGDRRLFPLLRGSLTVVGLGLALAALITWATAPDRLSRSSLSGLAWAGVTTILCIGPFLESTPRQRLYALDLETGDIEWATSRAGAGPVLVEQDLVVTDVEDQSLVGLDPETGRERWRHGINDADTQPRVERARAAGAYVPVSDDDTTPTTCHVADEAGISVVAGGLRGAGDDGEPWSLSFPGEAVLALAADNSAYAYVSTPGAAGADAGAIVRIETDGGRVQWRSALPEPVAVTGGCPAIGANDRAVVIAGGERIALLSADDGRLRWSKSVVALGKSRGYALPGAIQRVTVTDDIAYVSTTPES